MVFIGLAKSAQICQLMLNTSAGQIRIRCRVVWRAHVRFLFDFVPDDVSVRQRRKSLCQWRARLQKFFFFTFVPASLSLHDATGTENR